MDEVGGFFIEFEYCEDLRRALEIVSEKVMYVEGWEPELDGNTIGVYDDSPVEYDDFEGSLEKICKAIATAQPTDAFTATANYMDTDTKESAADRVSYKDGKLIVENMFASHEAVCPECGEKGFFLDAYEPDKPVRCEECGFKMPAADAYGTVPEYERNEVRILANS